MLDSSSRHTATACVIALSDIPNDPRVRRQCDALHDAGWNVIAIGIPGTDDPTVRWPILVRAEEAKTDASSLQSSIPPGYGPLKNMACRILGDRCWKFLMDARRQLTKMRVVRLLAKARWVRHLLRLNLQSSYGESMYWSWPNIHQMAQAAGAVQADLWLANDWTALPIAAKMAERCKGVYVYDSHEFAVNEYTQILRWRLFNRPVIKALERRYIVGAKVVSTVSSGIADALERMYSLSVKPIVIRNAPQYSESNFRPTGEAIRLLYHGIVAPGRGLEEAIASVPLWRPEYSLYIRGPGEAKYLQSLRDQIQALSLADRVFMLPPVPMIELVASAREFDVGFFALKGHSLQNHYVLPNKFFEYTMAGLALCVSDLSEMTRLCEQYGHGVVFKRLGPKDIADTVNGLTRDVIDAMKHKAIAASKDLCWNNEADRMLQLYNQAITG